MSAEDIPNGGVAEPGTPRLIAPGRVAVVTGAASVLTSA
jgi:hypothetical protein